ncbi:hypothetical protein DY000_02006965 [Brassica cretica]|uniref:RNase H type-1 domain-containing protein n=1 Tax=Brassica cretica TaxID=69181 RepID=A0ABQ7CHG4_BRACR|nr:hypothetical protein DY000_02006965 [Brassica cretica]
MEGMVKCNVNSKWRNSSSLSGGAWITRNQQGNVLHHTREAFTPSPNRLTAELRCIIWALQSVRDLGFQNVVIGLCSSFSSVIFDQESTKTNSIARDFARSVLRDGRFQSYLALGGPAWLHNRIRNEALPNKF